MRAHSVKGLILTLVLLGSSCKSADVSKGIAKDLPSPQVNMPSKAAEVMSKTAGPRPASVYTKAELDRGLYLLIAESKKEALKLKSQVHLDPNVKNKPSNTVWQMANNALKRSDDEIFALLTSDSYKRYREQLKEVKINVVDSKEALSLSSAETKRGFFLTNSSSNNDFSPENEAGATWLIAIGSLQIATIVPATLGIASVIVGAIIKDKQDKGESVDSGLLTAGKVINILSGSVASLVGLRVMARSLVGPTKGAAGFNFVVGAGILAIGVSQIVAGAQMGLTGGSKPAKTEGTLTLDRLKALSDGAHRLLDMREKAVL